MYLYSYGYVGYVTNLVLCESYIGTHILASQLLYYVPVRFPHKNKTLSKSKKFISPISSELRI